MNNLIKNLVIWLVIGLVLMTVFNQFNAHQAAQSSMEYSEFLDEVKQGRGRWAAAVIAGLADCSSDFGNAVEATRLKDFAAQAGDNVITHSICDGDLTAALEAALDTFTEACEVFPGPS